MKRYNLTKVMKDAHRLYNNEYQRRGRTWGECLKAAWRWEKDAVKTREEKEAKLQAMLTQAWAEHDVKMKQSEAERNPYNDLSIPSSAFYTENTRGRFGSRYVGD